MALRLEDVQQWALRSFGRHSHEYEYIVAAVHPSEEWLGNLMRLVERHGQSLEIGASATYMKRLRKNPQERIP